MKTKLALLAVAAMLVIAAVQVYRSVHAELTESVLARRASISYLAASTLGERLERLADLAVSLATRPRVGDRIAEGRWPETVEFLDKVPADFPFVERVFVTDLAGTLMADAPALGGVRGVNFAHRDWYQGVTRARAPYVSSVYQRTAEPRLNVFAAAAPVRGRDGEPIGILVLQVRIEKFFDWTRGIDIGPGGSVHVVDREGHLAHHPKSPAQGAIVNLSSNAIVARVRRGESGVAVGTDPVDGSEQLMAFAPTARGWGVIAQQPAAIAFAARNDQIVRLLTGYAVIAAFGAALVYLAVRLGAERRRAEEDLRAKAELEREVHSRTRELEAAARELADLYDNAPCGYHSVDAEGKFVRMNATWLAWLGYSRDEVVGKLRHPDIMTPASAEQFRTKWFPLFRRQGWLREVEFEYVRRDGSTFPASLDASSIHDEAGNYVMSRSTVYDITERKRIERERQALNARLEAANKELESFSYSVSHDLRAPLRAIDGYALMLQEDYAARLDNEGRRLLAVVRDEAGRMGQLIDDLLHFSRTGRQRLDAVPVDMRALVAEVITELRVAHPRAAIELAELPRAVGDRAMLRQVWVNLVGNALKYSAKAPEPRVEIGGRAAGADLEYWVRDNGVGFDPRYTERLFGVFQRLHREEEFPGTGVGLAIVQRVVARHGGRVAAEGRPGEGARFSFSLPASGSPA